MSTQATAKTLYLTVSDTKYAYRLLGTPSPTHPPLILLNHFRANIDLWDPQIIDPLATHRQLILYDYAGIGHSSGAVARSIRGFSRDLRGFLTSLLPTLATTQVDVLGFSLGGYVAQQLVLDAPELVNKMILSGTSASLGPGTERAMAEVLSAIMAPTPSGPAVVDAFFPSFIAREVGEAWLNRTLAARQAGAGKDGEPEWAFFLTGPGVESLIEAFLTWDADPVPFALLSTIQKDVLVTAGQNDLICPTRNAFELARRLPRANLVMYPGSGHGHLFQYAEVYVRQVLEFLDGGWPVPPFSAGVIRPLGREE